MENFSVFLDVHHARSRGDLLSAKAAARHLTSSCLSLVVLGSALRSLFL